MEKSYQKKSDEMEGISFQKLGLDSENLEKPMGVYMECSGGKTLPDTNCRGCEYLREEDENPKNFIKLICDFLNVDNTYELDKKGTA